MKIAIISGSSRANSQSHKIALWAEQTLQRISAEPVLIDLHQSVLPLDVDLDVDDIAKEPRAAKAWQPIADGMQGAEGFLIVSPEWNGMAAPALMNFFVYASADATHPLAHRPIQLFTVSNGRGGNYPVAQLRAFGLKNNNSFYMPGYVAVRDCKNVFNGSEPAEGNESDKYLQERAEHSLKLLIAYAEALTNLRRVTELNLLAYPNGM